MGGGRRSAAESGFTMIEVVVAMAMLLIGMFAAFKLLDASTRTVYSAQRVQAAVNRAQREMEAIRRLDYRRVALSAAPVTSSDANHPGSRVSGQSPNLSFDLDKSAGTDNAPVAIDAQNGQVSPGPTPFTTGSITGNVYRYVVWRDDPSCPVTCPGTQDYKRVVVAVKINSSALTSTTKRYIEVQSDITDPAEGVNGQEQLPPSGSQTTAQQFWLYDTPCSAGDRSDPSGSHATHDTLGDCDDAQIPGQAVRPPDLMWTSSPPDSAPADPAVPASYDYSSDVGGGSSGLRVAPHNGCDPSETDPTKLHRWATKKFSSDFAMTGKASFVFDTMSTGSSGLGAICVRLFRRSYTAPGVYSDATISTKDFSLTSWPALSGGWAQLSFTIDFSGLAAADRTIQAGQRLLLGLNVQQTSAVGLQFLYDHPDYATRLEVQTSTPLS